MGVFIYLFVILVSSSLQLSLSEQCGGLNCGAASCCLDQLSRPVCYSPSQYTCFLSTVGGILCSSGDLACGTSPRQFCYNPSGYTCVDGQLQQRPAGGGASTSSPTQAPSTQAPSTQAPSTQAPLTTTLSPTPTPTWSPSSTTPKATGTANSGACGSNNLNCGSQSCCVTRAGSGTCYLNTAYSCSSDGLLCPVPLQACGQACFNPNQYYCSNGQLQQTGSAGSSSTGTVAPTSPPSTSGGTSVPVTTTPSPSPSTSTTASSGSRAVKLWGINYSPKRPSGACPTLAEVEADLRILATLTTRIRIYSLVDCNQGQLVLQALANTGVDLRVTLGLWVDTYYSAEFPNEYGALINILNSGVRLDKVDDFIVGSETQYRGDFDWNILVGFMQNISSTLSIHGYTNIDVVTADVIYNLIGSAILNYENVIYVNQFPFWEGAAVDQAQSLLANTVNTLRNNAGGKQIIIGETGWPTGGDQLGSSLPSVNNLNTYLQSVVCYLDKQGIGYFWFSAFDEPFREDKQGGVERFFGLYSSDRTAKPGIQLPVMCPV